MPKLNTERLITNELMKLVAIVGSATKWRGGRLSILPKQGKLEIFYKGITIELSVKNEREDVIGFDHTVHIPIPRLRNLKDVEKNRDLEQGLTNYATILIYLLYNWRLQYF